MRITRAASTGEQRRNEDALVTTPKSAQARAPDDIHGHVRVATMWYRTGTPPKPTEAHDGQHLPEEAQVIQGLVLACARVNAGKGNRNVTP